MMKSSNTTKWPPRDQIASAFIKELRLRNREMALYWMLILIKIDDNSLGVLRLIRMFLIEDCLDMSSLQTAISINVDNLGRSDVENLAGRLFDIAMLESTPRFWETEAGRNAERSYWRIHAQVESDLKAGTLKSIPDYAIDCHTEQGRNNPQPPHRFSGTQEGRLSMCDEFEKRGRLG